MADLSSSRVFGTLKVSHGMYGDVHPDTITFDSGTTLKAEAGATYITHQSHASTGGFRFNNSSGSLKGYIYQDSGGFGLLNSSGQWGFRTNGSTSYICYGGSTKIATTSTGCTVTGVMYSSGDVTGFSDIRLKEKIEKLDNPIERLFQFSGNTFWRKDLEMWQTGLLAQEVEAAIPHSIHETEEGIKGVAIMAPVALLVEVCKDQQRQIDELKRQTRPWYIKLKERFQCLKQKIQN